MRAGNLVVIVYDMCVVSGLAVLGGMFVLIIGVFGWNGYFDFFRGRGGVEFVEVGFFVWKRV